MQGVAEAQPSVVDPLTAPDSVFSGNLYVELVGHWPWARSDRKALENSCENLRRRYPSISKAAKESGVEVEQFLFDTMFADLLPARLSLAKLTFPRGTRDVNIDVTLRLDGGSRPAWPLPKGVALVAKARWHLQGIDRQTDDIYTNKNPSLQIWSFHDGPSGPSRTFEVDLDVICRQVARLERGVRKQRNVLTKRLADSLPAISALTAERLKDWNDFLEWKRRLIHANREALRYTSRTIAPNRRSVVFRTMGATKEDLQQAISRLSRSDYLSALDTSVSEDPWSFEIPEDEREPRGGSIGRRTKARPRIEAVEGTDSPWDDPVSADVAFYLLEEDQELIERSGDPDAAVERVLKSIPQSGFIVQGVVQDLAPVNRQASALAALSDQGGFSPHLARYIFDASEARIPTSQPMIDNWTIGHLNVAQRSAVKKILAAPDLCLIQGPPGTGKTTVIAESIAQVAQRNETVLLASQTHTAVDNALIRLPLHPSIRAVRLTRNEDRLSDEGQEFLNERALRRYYNALADTTATRNRDAQEQARFAEKFDRIRNAATRYIDQLASSEGNVDDLRERVTQSASVLVEYTRRLQDAGIVIESLDDPDEFSAQLSAMDQSIKLLKAALPHIEHQMQNVLAGASSPSLSSAGSRRKELTDQLAVVLEKMKVDASAVSEYQNLQAELDALDEEDLANEPIDDTFQTYFPDAAQRLSDPRNRMMARLQKGKRVKAAKDVLARINNVNQLLPQFDQARAEFAAQSNALDEAESDLKDHQDDAKTYFMNHGREIVGSADLSQLPSAAELRNRLDKFLAENASLLNEAKTAARELDAWGDIRNDWIADLSAEDVAERDWDALGDDWLAECNVVGVTCNENPRTLDEPGLTNFDLTIIDEVSKATPLELLMPLMRARRSVLVGDHRQLPPMFRESQDAEGIGDKADEDIPEELALTKENLYKYEKFVTASLFRAHFERADDSIKERLTVQYRMHPDIMDSVSHFYEGQLTSGIQEPDEKRSHGLTILGRGDLPVISPDQHIIWIDTTMDDRGNPWKEPSSNSEDARTNLIEARLIVRMLRDIDDALASNPANGGRFKEIGIVSMYQAQVRCIRQEINRETRDRPFKAIKYELNTVVKYQGKEKPIILVSMVRNFGPNASMRRRSSRANVARFEYINVAFSRAQELLVIFGARDTFAPYKVELPPMDATGSPIEVAVYREICDAIERNGAVKQATALGELPKIETRKMQR